MEISYQLTTFVSHGWILLVNFPGFTFGRAYTIHLPTNTNITVEYISYLKDGWGSWLTGDIIFRDWRSVAQAPLEDVVANVHSPYW